MLAYRLVKLLAILIGGPVAAVGAMALVGLATDNLWVRLGVALVALVVLPLVVAERLLPDDDPSRGRGIPSEVFAVSWLGLGVLSLALAGPLVASEGVRFSEDGMPRVGALVVALSGVDADETAPESIEDVGLSEDAGVDAFDAADGQLADAGLADAGQADASPRDAEQVDASPEVAEASEPEPNSGELTVAELFQRWRASVVSVRVGGGGGTGFIIDDDGTVATNQHVTNGSEQIFVKLVDGTWASQVELLFENAEVDIALLRIEAPGVLSPVQLGNSEEVQVGERAVSIGNPLGLEHTVTDGLVSARRLIRGRRMIQMSTPVSPGNSGGPLFNLRGQVIGVTTAQYGRFSSAQNLNLAVPVDVLEEQLKDDYPDRRSVGGGEPSGSGTW